jgi:hypothetical protein
MSNAEQNNRDNVECKTHGILSYEQAEKITIDGWSSINEKDSTHSVE